MIALKSIAAGLLLALVVVFPVGTAAGVEFLLAVTLSPFLPVLAVATFMVLVSVLVSVLVGLVRSRR